MFQFELLLSSLTVKAILLTNDLETLPITTSFPSHWKTHLLMRQTTFSLTNMCAFLNYLLNQQFFLFCFLIISYLFLSYKVPVGFKSNGKPGHIYHWNIPVLKKIIGINQSRRNPNSRHADDTDELLDIRHIPTWTNPWENETNDKQFAGVQHNDIGEKVLKKKSPVYYAPKPKSTHLHNYLANNGKPDSFYVIDHKSHKARYHKLISWTWREFIFWQNFCSNLGHK